MSSLAVGDECCSWYVFIFWNVISTVRLSVSTEITWNSCDRENELRAHRVDAVRTTELKKINIFSVAVNWDNIVPPLAISCAKIRVRMNGCFFYSQFGIRFFFVHLFNERHFNSKAATGWDGKIYKMNENNQIITFSTQQDFSIRIKDFLVDIICKMPSCIVCASLTFGLP